MNVIKIKCGILTAAYSLVFLTCLGFSTAVSAALPVWPIEIQGEKGTVLIYQPQPETFIENDLTARAAVAVILRDQEEPVFGAAWFEASLSTDRDTRMVTIDEVRVPRVRFPDATEEQETRLAQFLTDNFPKSDVGISLDQLLTTLELAEQERIAAESLETAPPRIVFTTQPSILITIDGQPQLQPVEKSKVMQVVNTPFLVLFDPKAKTYFLKGGPAWFSAAEISEEWKFEPNVPKEILSLVPPEEKEEREETPPVDASNAPRIIVATEPTELIVTEGDPKFTPLSGSDIMFVSNSESDVFFEPETGTYFVLLAGRWYNAHSLEGPWTYRAADQLPPAFAQIPPDSEKMHVLANVAGTDQAADAVLDAGIPQTTALKRDQEVDLAVTYDGRPQFEPIENTNLEYAVNTGHSVIQADDRYYCCHEAAWYDSDTPEGPWSVSTEVPREIYTIPPSCPVYNVKYVHVYDTTPEVVYVGYQPGYTGTYVYGPTVVYGTGYHYPGWYGSVYYPRQVTWGFHAGYSVSTGSWNLSFGFGVGSGWYRPMVPGGGWFAPGFGAGFVAGAITAGAIHNWWGPGGWHRPTPYRGGYRPQVKRQYGYKHNIYNRPHNRPRNVKRPKPAQLPHGQRPRDKSARPRNNNVYTDRHGNVYRKHKDGWQKRDKSGWKNAPPSQLPAGQRPGQKPGVGVKPGQLPATGARPGQKPGAGVKPGQLPATGARPGQKPGAGVKPGQLPATGARPGQKPGAGVKPGQLPATGARPGQKPGAGVKPGQLPATGARPGQKPGAGVKPGQLPATGARPGQKPGAGVKPGQLPATGARPGQKPGAGVKPGQLPATGARPGQKPGAGVKPGQLPATGPRPQQQPRVQQPRTQQPRVQQPRTQQPRVQQPRTQRPRVQQPRTQQPRVQQPRTQQPRVQQPRTQRPRVQQPRTQQPRVQQPRTQQPRVQQPRTQQPRVQQPRTQQPRVQRQAPGRSLQRQHQNRQRGAQRANNFQRQRSSGGKTRRR